jgi:prepilin-type N-terminal cleavage/methylation domain-containing protein
MISGIKDNRKMERETSALKRADGFTLIEVIMAVSVLTVGLLAVASMQVSAIRGNSISREYTESTDRVQDVAEWLLALPSTNANLQDRDGDGTAGLNHANTDPSAPDAADYFTTTQLRTSGITYTVYWNVATNWAGGKSLTGVNTVRVIVKWTIRGADKVHSFDLLRTRI